MSLSVPPAHSPEESPRPTDGVSRATMLLFLVSSFLWLIAGGALLLVHSIQLHTVGFFAAMECLTFGRVQAAAESALVYGWIANSGFMVCWWILGRLGGGPSRGASISFFAAIFWNLGVTYGVGGILHGDLGAYALFQMPAAVVPVLGVSYAAFAVAGIMAWTGRGEAASFAAQWYAVASLYALPWVCSAAYMMLQFHVVPGVSQAVLAAWAGEALRLLWIAPMTLAIAYYLAPKITGRSLSGYSYANVGFWILVVIAPWVGTRQLAGGPVPVWVPTVGISCSFLLLLHYLIIASNLRAMFARTSRSIALRFILLGVVSYLLLGAVDTVLALRSIAAATKFTYVVQAREMLLIFGVFTPSVFGAIYFLLPRLTGRAWASDGLIASHFTCTWVGLLAMVAGLAVAGLEQGISLADPNVGYEVITSTTKPWLLVATHGIGVTLLGAILVLVNLVYHFLPVPKESGAAAAQTIT